jgi:hypothetical protein
MEKELTKPLRPIGDIYSELSKHPDFVAGAYYDKETVIDIIAQEIVDGDDEYLYSKAEEILNNNFYQIQKNIEGCWEQGQEHLDFTDGCDLPE